MASKAKSISKKASSKVTSAKKESSSKEKPAPARAKKSVLKKPGLKKSAAEKTPKSSSSSKSSKAQLLKSKTAKTGTGSKVGAKTSSKKAPVNKASELKSPKKSPKTPTSKEKIKVKATAKVSSPKKTEKGLSQKDAKQKKAKAKTPAVKTTVSKVIAVKPVAKVVLSATRTKGKSSDSEVAAPLPVGKQSSLKVGAKASIRKGAKSSSAPEISAISKVQEPSSSLATSAAPADVPAPTVSPAKGKRGRKPSVGLKSTVDVISSESESAAPSAVNILKGVDSVSSGDVKAKVAVESKPEKLKLVKPEPSMPQSINSLPTSVSSAPKVPVLRSVSKVKVAKKAKSATSGMKPSVLKDRPRKLLSVTTKVKALGVRSSSNLRPVEPKQVPVRQMPVTPVPPPAPISAPKIPVVRPVNNSPRVEFGRPQRPASGNAARPAISRDKAGIGKPEGASSLTPFERPSSASQNKLESSTAPTTSVTQKPKNTPGK